MTKLDDKLKDIVGAVIEDSSVSWQSTHYDEIRDTAIPQIKQAFADEGWIKSKAFEASARLHQSQLINENNEMRKVFKQIVSWGQDE